MNYYRANATAESFAQGGLMLPPIQAPTMGVGTSGDFALTETQMTNSAASITGPWRYEQIEGPGHWMQLEAPEAVNRLLTDFLPV